LDYNSFIWISKIYLFYLFNKKLLIYKKSPRDIATYNYDTTYSDKMTSNCQDAVTAVVTLMDQMSVKYLKMVTVLS